MANPKQHVPWTVDASYDAINILSYGDAALSNASDAVNQAIADIGKTPQAKGAIYFPPFVRAYTFLTDCTVSENVQFIIGFGAQLNVASGKTLTLSGGYSGSSGSFTGTVTLQNIEKVDVRDFGVKLNDSNDYRAEFQRALTAVGAISYSSSAVGGILSIPSGLINIDNTSTSLNVPSHVRILGQAWVWSASSYSPSTIKGTGTAGTPLFDLSSASHPTLEKLSLIGGNGTALGNHAIYASTVSASHLIELNIDRWGGSAIYLGGGADNTLANNQNTNCMRGYAGLTTYTGAYHLLTSETRMSYCNVNGAIGNAVRGDITAQTITAGAHDYACAIYVGGSIMKADWTVGAFADYGWYFASSNLHEISNCRGERCQGNGWRIVAAQSHFENCIAADNSRDATGTYSGFQVGTGGLSGYENTFVNNYILNALDSNYLHSYGFDVNAGNAGTYASRNIFVGNRMGLNEGNVALYHFAGTAPYEVEGKLTDVMTYAATISLDVTHGTLHKTTTVNATGDATINASAGGLSGQTMDVLVVNDATSGKTITFGTNFKPSATVVGTASKGAMIRFVSDGTSWWENGRTLGL